MGRAMMLVAIVAASAAVDAAQRRGSAPPGAKAPKVATAATCASELGAGVASQRQFCDIVITVKPGESVTVPIPAHTGAPTLKFDLHNRFTIPGPSVSAAEAFARQSAMVAVTGADGVIIDRAVVTREFRTAQDLFDQLTGGSRPGGVKGIGPGQPVPVTIELPAGTAIAGIVGVRLEQFTLGVAEIYDAPGRAIAIASNIRVEYISR